MPMYEYQCECSYFFRAYRSIDSRHHCRCPECGSLKTKKLLTMPMVDTNTVHRDCKGERIWFPKDGKPYYDRFLGKTFNSAKQKSEYMKKHGKFMDGSSDKPQSSNPAEAGPDRTGKRLTVNF